MTALSLDLRKRIVARYARGDITYVELAETFGVGEATVSRLLRIHREGRSLVPNRPGGGFPPRIAPEQFPALVKLVAEKPDRTVAELCELWLLRRGGEISESSMKRALRRAGLTWKKKRFDPPSKTEPTSKKSGSSSSKRSRK